jgi:GNAT superfamily N-acetyltransferase
VSIEHVVRVVQYSTADASLRRQIALLLHSVYAPASALLDPPPPAHDPALDATSFYIGEGNRVVSYAAVVRLTIGHGGRDFALAGLSAVATAPEFRRRGLGMAVVEAATRHIEASDADLALFTCDESVRGFYERAGWQIAPDVKVVGSDEGGALTSDRLGKVVFMRLLSVSAYEARAAFERYPVNLGLPEGEFL